MIAAARASAPSWTSARIPLSLFAGVFTGAFAGLIAVAAVAIALGGQGRPDPLCQPPRPCAPPIETPRLTTGVTWHSAAGVTASYDRSWNVVKRDETTLELRNDRVLLWMTVVPSAAAAQSAYRERVAALKDDLPDLVEDDAREHRVLGAGIGYQPGVGGTFRGTTFRAPRTPMSVVVLAATKGRATVVASAATAITDWVGTRTDQAHEAVQVFADADLVLDSVQWQETAP